MQAIHKYFVFSVSLIPAAITDPFGRALDPKVVDATADVAPHLRTFKKEAGRLRQRLLFCEFGGSNSALQHRDA